MVDYLHLLLCHIGYVFVLEFSFRNTSYNSNSTERFSVDFVGWKYIQRRGPHCLSTPRCSIFDPLVERLDKPDGVSGDEKNCEAEKDYWKCNIEHGDGW